MLVSALKIHAENSHYIIFKWYKICQTQQYRVHDTECVIKLLRLQTNFCIGTEI